MREKERERKKERKIERKRERKKERKGERERERERKKERGRGRREGEKEWRRGYMNDFRWNDDDDNDWLSAASFFIFTRFFPSIGGHRLLLSLCTRLYKRTHGTYSLSHTTNTYIDTTHSVALNFTHVTHPLHKCLTLTLTQDGHAYTSKNFFNLTF